MILSVINYLLLNCVFKVWIRSRLIQRQLPRGWKWLHLNLIWFSISSWQYPPGKNSYALSATETKYNVRIMYNNVTNLILYSRLSEF